MRRRLLKVYYRDEKGVFRAIDGLKWSRLMLFMHARFWYLEDEDDDFYVFKKVIE